MKTDLGIYVSSLTMLQLEEGVRELIYLATMTYHMLDPNSIQSIITPPGVKSEKFSQIVVKTMNVSGDINVP